MLLLVAALTLDGGILHRHINASYLEPDPREYNMLKSKSSKNLIVLNSALSDSTGTVDFYLCAK